MKISKIRKGWADISFHASTVLQFVISSIFFCNLYTTFLPKYFLLTRQNLYIVLNNVYTLEWSNVRKCILIMGSATFENHMSFWSTYDIDKLEDYCKVQWEIHKNCISIKFSTYLISKLILYCGHQRVYSYCAIKH